MKCENCRHKIIDCAQCGIKFIANEDVYCCHFGANNGDHIHTECLSLPDKSKVIE